MLFNTWRVVKESVGQNTTLVDCVLSTSDVTIITSFSLKKNSVYRHFVTYL